MSKTARMVKDSGIEWIGKIPVGWETIRFKKVHNTSNVGNAIDKEYWSDNPEDKYFYTAQVEPIHTSFKDFPHQKFTNSNDLLLARNGTPYVYFPYEGSIYSDHIIRVDLKSGFNRKFIQHALQTSIKTETVTGVSILTWSVSIWDRQVLPFPPLPEQNRIAAYLDRKCGKIDSVIAGEETAIEKLKAYKQSLITETVTKGLDPNAPMKDSGIEWIGKIPVGWEVVQLKRIARIQTGNTPSKAKNEPFYSLESGYMWIKAEDLGTYQPIRQTSEYLTDEGIKEGRLFPPATVFVCCIASVGKVGFCDQEASCNQQINALIFDKAFWKFGFYMTVAQESEYLFYATGNVVKILNSERQSRIMCPLPPLSEQKRIAAYLDKKCAAIDSNIASRQSLIEKLTAYKKSLIYEVVTGKKEV